MSSASFFVVEDYINLSSRNYHLSPANCKVWGVCMPSTGGVFGGGTSWGIAQIHVSVKGLSSGGFRASVELAVCFRALAKWQVMTFCFHGIQKRASCSRRWLTQLLSTGFIEIKGYCQLCYDIIILHFTRTQSSICSHFLLLSKGTFFWFKPDWI